MGLVSLIADTHSRRRFIAALSASLVYNFLPSAYANENSKLTNSAESLETIYTHMKCEIIEIKIGDNILKVGPKFPYKRNGEEFVLWEVDLFNKAAKEHFYIQHVRGASPKIVGATRNDLPIKPEELTRRFGELTKIIEEAPHLLNVYSMCVD